jgi:CBS domain-containing protein
MKTHQAKRVVITIEAIMQSRLTDAMEAAGVTGYSILPVLGGSGRSGAFKVVDKHIGVVTISDVEVLRAERF